MILNRSGPNIRTIGAIPKGYFNVPSQVIPWVVPTSTPLGIIVIPKGGVFQTSVMTRSELLSPPTPRHHRLAHSTKSDTFCLIALCVNVACMVCYVLKGDGLGWGAPSLGDDLGWGVEATRGAWWCEGVPPILELLERYIMSPDQVIRCCTSAMRSPFSRIAILRKA